MTRFILLLILISLLAVAAVKLYGITDANIFAAFTDTPSSTVVMHLNGDDIRRYENDTTICFMDTSNHSVSCQDKAH